MTSITTSRMQYLKRKNSGKEVNIPKGLCPNCWGRQEYGGQFFEKLKNHAVDINTDEPEIAWINDYAEKHLLGIKLHAEEGGVVCQKCKYSFKAVS